MSEASIAGVRITPLRRIATSGGDVLHALKSSDSEFAGFGEAYFSTVDSGAIKGWKRHRTMLMNLVVPAGAVRFVLFDDRPNMPETFLAVDLSPDSADSYVRLTVPPGVWMAFTGTGPGLNLVLNLASIPHDPAEADNKPLDAIAWSWSD
ncbi:MAG TPA: dTDP-4-dehydrorhamnose 3,5-epimerase [Allosphingosinicella sp.]|nr:dTDP-4-dehydrorhamnose 3,5-epimerase [Allosphingosinicella sp.]